jgi:hypothetical protein
MRKLTSNTYYSLLNIIANTLITLVSNLPSKFKINLGYSHVGCITLEHNTVKHKFSVILSSKIFIHKTLVKF